jgi:copper/silver efflux system protein
VPLALFIIFILFYVTFRSLTETLMVMLGVPLSVVGGLWLLVWLDYNMSIAVWVGFIALAGAAAEMTAVMLAYLDSAYRDGRRTGRLRTLEDLIDTVHATAVERVRPMALIGLTNILAMFPVMWSTGTGADVMKRVAAPMVGGISSALLLTLVVIPVLYVSWRWHAEVGRGETTA